MIERFLIAWPDSPSEWRDVDRWPDSAARRSAWAAFDRLDSLSADAVGAERDTDPHGDARGLPFLRFGDDALEIFIEWRAGLERGIRATEIDAMESTLTKFRHHVPALALLLHVVDGGVGPVTRAAALRALALAEYFESHARRLHASDRRLAVVGAKRILGKVRSGDLAAEFTLRDVHQRGWSGLTEQSSVSDALDLLAAHGWLSETEMSTGGRPKLLYSLTEGARHG